MLSITLPGTDIETTPLGYGCARLLRVGSHKAQQRILSAALEAGVRHFDVARMYGLGAAEAELGAFAKGKRDQLVIATKFGIEPGTLRRMARVQAAGRRTIARHPQLRRVVRGAVAATAGPRRYDIESARRSLEVSLSAIGTDYIDLFLLHEPNYSDFVAPELATFLDSKRQAGVIRAWGISGDMAPSMAISDRIPVEVPVLQVRSSDPGWQGWVEPVRSAQIAFGVVERPLAMLSTVVLSDSVKVAQWSEALGHQFTSSYAVSLLIAAAQQSVGGPVLYSTTQKSRIEGAAHAVSDQSVLESVETFRALWRGVFHGSVADG